ncbi:MAG: Fe-S cluster assembly ATPase SufC, partial [Enterobacteriaceae bacterium]|nr:Fe-S cluster assembly ATPase SufC [Enterobacteriaceae bacterium]
MNYLMEIIGLNVYIDNKKILDNLNLNVKYGEVHVIMGPNGAGKSTLAKILTGNQDNYTLSGDIVYNGSNINGLSPDELALKGVFLSFQYPVSIPGLTNIQFLRTIINSKRKYKNIDPIDTIEFIDLVKDYMKRLDIKEEFLYRFVNDGFSGGEKKRNEILQMLLLNPSFIILDEVDSGLDVDSLRCVANGINFLKSDKNAFLIITH